MSHDNGMQKIFISNTDAASKHGIKKQIQRKYEARNYQKILPHCIKIAQEKDLDMEET